MRRCHLSPLRSFILALFSCLSRGLGVYVNASFHLTDNTNHRTVTPPPPAALIPLYASALRTHMPASRWDAHAGSRSRNTQVKLGFCQVVRNINLQSAPGQRAYLQQSTAEPWFCLKQARYTPHQAGPADKRHTSVASASQRLNQGQD